MASLPKPVFQITENGTEVLWIYSEVESEIIIEVLILNQ